MATSFGRGSVVGLTGLEPVTSSLSGKRSNRLSYRPVRRPAAPPSRVARCTRLPHRHPPQNGPQAGDGRRRSGRRQPHTGRYAARSSTRGRPVAAV